MTNLTLLGYDYAAYIKDLKEFKDLVNINKQIEKELKEEFNNYMKIKNEYEEVLVYGSFHPNYKEIANKFIIAKTNLYTNDLMIEQKRLYDFLESTINEFIKDVANSISLNIPVINEIGFISKKGGITCVSK